MSPPNWFDNYHDDEPEDGREFDILSQGTLETRTALLSKLAYLTETLAIEYNISDPDLDRLLEVIFEELDG